MASAIVCAVAALVLLAGCAQTGTASEKEFRVGAILHLTGSDLAEPDEAFRDGMLLAADELNANGGVNGKTVRVIVEDDATNLANALTVAQKLINADRVDAAIDATFRQVQVNGKLFEEAKTPVIVLWDSNPEIENLGEYQFAIGPWTPSSGEASAEFAYRTLGSRKAAVIYNAEEWSSAVAGFFKTKFESLGGTILDSYAVDLAASHDYRTVIAKAMAQDPDVIYAPVTDGLSTFFIQLKTAGYAGKTITSDIITDNVIEASNGATEGVYQTIVLDPTDTPQVLHMKQLYRQKFGRDPTQVLFVAWGYDAVRILAHAAQNASDGEEIKDNLYRIQGFEGASKTISFDSKGSSATPPDIVVVTDGKLVKADTN
jgi:branched-chain amino acid transport system substrate-binding protein